MRLPLLPMTFSLLLLSLISTVTTKEDCRENYPSMKLPEAIEGINNFGFNLMRKLSQDTSYIVSPYTLWKTFSHAAVGAEGETLRQILDVLGMKEKKGIINIAKKLGLKSNLEDINGKIVSAHAVRIFIMKSFSTNTCENELADIVTQVDFANLEPACDKINTFIRKATHGQIPKIVNCKNVEDRTKMVLVNVLYLKGWWKHPFDRKKTSRKEFIAFKEPKKVFTKMMYHPALPVKYGLVDCLESHVVQLPIGSEFFHMTIFLPELKGEPPFITLQDKLNNEKFKSALNKLNNVKLPIHIPKFYLETKFTRKMIKALKELGMKHAFGKQANFSSFGEDIHIDHAIQQTRIELNEEGVTPSGTTGGEVREHYYRMSVDPILLNRPFIYVIHTPEIIIFTGAYMRPNK